MRRRVVRHDFPSFGRGIPGDNADFGPVSLASQRGVDRRLRQCECQSVTNKEAQLRTECQNEANSQREENL